MSRAIPPLLMIAEGRRPRARRVPTSAPREIELHMSVAGLLRRHIGLGWIWGHVPSGELRDQATAGKLRAMGAPKGWADLFLFSPAGRLHAMELKRIGEDLSPEQDDFRAWCSRATVAHAVVRSMPEVLATFADWSCLRSGGGQ